VIAGTIADYKSAISIFQEDKRVEVRVAGYRFVASYSTDCKMHMCMTGGTKY
jgi:hypothetical protein